MDTIEKPSRDAGGERAEERRSAPRRRVFKGATLAFNRGYGALECVVRNETARGALLVFGETSAVPNAFDLAIKGEPASRGAAVRWRTMTHVGVEFG